MIWDFHNLEVHPEVRKRCQTRYGYHQHCCFLRQHPHRIHGSQRDLIVREKCRLESVVVLDLEAAWCLDASGHYLSDHGHSVRGDLGYMDHGHPLNRLVHLPKECYLARFRMEVEEPDFLSLVPGPTF